MSSTFRKNLKFYKHHQNQTQATRSAVARNQYNVKDVAIEGHMIKLACSGEASSSKPSK